jgi:hypothetical protein
MILIHNQLHFLKLILKEERKPLTTHNLVRKQLLPYALLNQNEEKETPKVKFKKRHRAERSDVNMLHTNEFLLSEIS